MLRRKNLFLIFFICFVLIELIIIIILILNFQKAKHNILGTISVNPINKDNIYYNPYSKLKYFFEPLPNRIEYSDPSVTWAKALYTINSDSLNSPQDFSITKQNNIYRIVTLGDSFTFGMFVNTKDNWPQQLQNLLENNLKCKNFSSFEVINLGEYGYDIQYSVERYRIRGQKYNPNLVLWFLKDDDFLEINEIMRKNEQKYADEMKKSGEWEKLTKLGNSYPPNIKMHLDMENEYKKIGERNFIKMQGNFLEDINKYFKNSLIVFTFPFTQNKFKLAMQQFVDSRNNIAPSFFYDRITDIYKLGDANFPDSHPNEKGHKIIAHDLFNYLTKNKIIPCD